MADAVDTGNIYHKNGRIAIVGPGSTNSGFAYHDNGARAFIGPGVTNSGYGYYRNGVTAYVASGTARGYAYRSDGSRISTDGSGVGYMIGPGIRIHVSKAGMRFEVDDA